MVKSTHLRPTSDEEQSKLKTIVLELLEALEKHCPNGPDRKQVVLDAQISVSACLTAATHMTAGLADLSEDQEFELYQEMGRTLSGEARRMMQENEVATDGPPPAD